MLTVLDEYTREALSVAVRSKMSASDVLDALYLLFIKYGKPKFIRSDNGPAFVAAQLREWLQRVSIKPGHIFWYRQRERSVQQLLVVAIYPVSSFSFATNPAFVCVRTGQIAKISNWLSGFLKKFLLRQLRTLSSTA